MDPITKEISNYTKEVFQRIAEEYEFEIDTMEVMKDHVHLFLSAPPRYSPARIVQIMKSISSREVFRRFPHLKEILWKMELWSDGYFVRTVGDRVTAEVIERYIKYQHQEEQLGFWVLAFDAPQLAGGLFTVNKGITKVPRFFSAIF